MLEITNITEEGTRDIKADNIAMKNNIVDLCDLVKGSTGLCASYIYYGSALGFDINVFKKANDEELKIEKYFSFPMDVPFNGEMYEQCISVLTGIIEKESQEAVTSRDSDS